MFNHSHYLGNKLMVLFVHIQHERVKRVTTDARRVVLCPDDISDRARPVEKFAAHLAKPRSWPLWLIDLSGQTSRRLRTPYGITANSCSLSTTAFSVSDRPFVPMIVIGCKKLPIADLIVSMRRLTAHRHETSRTA